MARRMSWVAQPAHGPESAHECANHTSEYVKATSPRAELRRESQPSPSKPGWISAVGAEGRIQRVHVLLTEQGASPRGTLAVISPSFSVGSQVVPCLKTGSRARARNITASHHMPVSLHPLPLVTLAALTVPTPATLDPASGTPPHPPLENTPIFGLENPRGRLHGPPVTSREPS